MKAIVARNLKGFIGKNGKLPWKSRADLEHFKTLTMGAKLLVGRKTFENLPPLPGRELIVVGTGYNTLQEALSQKPDWVIGGKQLYESTAHLITGLHISIINDKTIGDVEFPNFEYYKGYIHLHYFDVDEKKPDNIVWSQEAGYDAKLKNYPTNLGSPSFDLPNISLAKTAAGKKMIDVFEREKQELIEKAKKLQEEYDSSVMVWESIMSFEPIVGHTYYLYDFQKGKTLSLLAPNEWNKNEFFIGAFVLTSENKWIKK
jgi:dihydrofolate reductase